MIWRADAGSAEVHEHTVRVDESSGTLTVP
jgi:hypothetical protein